MLIQVSGLQKTYHMGPTEVHALRGVDLDVAHGAFMAIIVGSCVFLNGSVRPPDYHWSTLLTSTIPGDMDPETLAHLQRLETAHDLQEMLNRFKLIKRIYYPFHVQGDILVDYNIAETRQAF